MRFLLFIIIFIIILTFSTPFIDFLLKRDIENQISYLEVRFKNHLGEKLQNKYPEGILFGNLIYALSLIEYSNKGQVVDSKNNNRANQKSFHQRFATKIRCILQ